jgi:hypothetical protein
MVLNLLFEIVDIIVLDPTQSEIISVSIVPDVGEAPAIDPERYNPDRESEYVKQRPPKASVVLDHGCVPEVPFVLDGNFEEHTGPESDVLVLFRSDFNIEYSVKAVAIIISVHSVCSQAWISNPIYYCSRTIKIANTPSNCKDLTSRSLSALNFAIASISSLVIQRTLFNKISVNWGTNLIKSVSLCII